MTKLEVSLVDFFQTSMRNKMLINEETKKMLMDEKSKQENDDG